MQTARKLVAAGSYVSVGVAFLLAGVPPGFFDNPWVRGTLCLLGTMCLGGGTYEWFCRKAEKEDTELQQQQSSSTLPRLAGRPRHTKGATRITLSEAMLRDQRRELAEPIIDFIDEQMMHVQKWMALSKDIITLSSILSYQTPVLLERYASEIERATRVSPELFQELSAAGEHLRLFDYLIESVRSRHSRDSKRGSLHDYNYLPSIREARGSLLDAEMCFYKARSYLKKFMTMRTS